MRVLRVSSVARRDIVRILARSQEVFGEQARLRYQELIEATLRDIFEYPEDPRSRLREELGQNVRTRHLMSSRKSVVPSTKSVVKPRHMFVYWVDDDRVLIGRLLHERMELVRWLEGPGASG